jgi:hypothetical protein
MNVKPLIYGLILLLTLTGCSTNPVSGLFDWAKSPIESVVNGPLDVNDPLVQSAIAFTRFGVLMVVGGLVFGGLTKFRSGVGLTFVWMGLALILLAWTIQQFWWLALCIGLSFAVYKLYNWLNPDVETENILE